jgi:hypothetical protein
MATTAISELATASTAAAKEDRVLLEGPHSRRKEPTVRRRRVVFAPSSWLGERGLRPFRA